MAGFRDFQTGEVLTAANVNDFLAKQSVMKFADASARDTALGTAVGGSNALREGMVAYLDDTDEVLAYDGTAWGSVGLPLGTATPTDGQILAYGTATSTWNPTDQLAGIGSNFVLATSSASFSTTQTTAQDVPGASVAITLTSPTSRVMVIATASWFQQSTDGGYGIAGIVGPGGNIYESFIRAGRADQRFTFSMAALDIPGSIGPHNYKLTLNVSTSGGGTAQLGSDIRIMAIEVAA